MVWRTRPGVLVVDGDAAGRRQIAVLLGEVGIGVTAVADGAAARAAMARDRFDLAVVGASAWPGAAGLGLQIVLFDQGEPRRSIGRVRDGLLGAESARPSEAEEGIAAAKRGCLEQRQHAARLAGVAELVASLAREIAEMAAPARLMP